MLTIEKRLKIRGSAEPTAVMLNDTGELYPVLLESLHNNVLFPELINSGYELTGLPYQFVRNGVKFDQIPIEDYNPTEAEEERMYNSIGVKLTQEELKSHISYDSIAAVETPPTKFTIFTREEFLNYLDEVQKSQSELDYLPINYFVHPDALFSPQEFISDAYKEYVSIITQRRVMSHTRFIKLLTWLESVNLNPNYTDQDVLDAYFAWGLDGLRDDIVKIEHTDSVVRLAPQLSQDMNSNYIYDTVDGFTDINLNQFIPESAKNRQWEIHKGSLSTAETLGEIQMLKESFGSADNKLLPVVYKSRTKQVHTVMNMRGGYTIKIATNNIVTMGRSYLPIVVKSPTNPLESVPLFKALPGSAKLLYEDSLVNTMAKEIFESRIPKINVSSYRALCIAGLSSYRAIEYICQKLNALLTSGSFDPDSGRQQKQQVVDSSTIKEIPKFEFRDIDDFVCGKMASDIEKTPTDDLIAKYEFLNDIVRGNINIDGIDIAYQELHNHRIESYITAIKAIHNVMNIPYDEIYRRFLNRGAATVIPFEYKGITYNLDVSPLDGIVKEYKKDLQMYNEAKAAQSFSFFYIVNVAKEVGDERADRHVAIEFYEITKKYKVVKEQLSLISSRYLEKVQSITDSMRRDRFAAMVNNFAIKSLFTMALNGDIEWPAELGGAVERVSPDLQAQLKQCCSLKIETINNVLKWSHGDDGIMNQYCVNALITENHVIPKSNNSPIHVVPFYALWYDYRQFPELWNKLVTNGVLKPDFIPWSVRDLTSYYNSQSLNIFDLEKPGSLMNYYERAVHEVAEWPSDIDFIHVKSIAEELYPEVYKSPENYEEQFDVLPAPRTEKPKINVYTSQDIVMNDMVKYLNPEQLAQEKPTSYIHKFNGFSTEVLINKPEALSAPLGMDDVGGILVLPSRDLIYCEDFRSSGAVDFRNLVQLDKDKYGIVNVYDRIYLFKDVRGDLWEVRI